MVEYVIKSGSDIGGIEEWSIVELQGELEIRKSGSDNFDGKYFGDLHFDKSGHPVLILGSDFIIGRICTFMIVNPPDITFKGIIFYKERSRN